MADMAISSRTRLPTGIWQVDPDHSRIGFAAKHLTDPTGWGMTFNQVLGSGNLVVSDRVELQLDISAVRQR